MLIFLCLLVGILFGTAVYLILDKELLRIILGTVILSYAVNLILLIMGRFNGSVPAIQEYGSDRLLEQAVNPLPQALILTAIVISFSFTAVLLVMNMFQQIHQNRKSPNKVDIG